MPQSNRDDPSVRDNRDRVWVSRTEYWELGAFVDAYLENRGLARTPENRRRLREAIRGYGGRIPLEREGLELYLDEQFADV